MKIYTQAYGLGKVFAQNLDGTIERLHEMGFDGIEPLVIFREQQGRFPMNAWALDTLKTAYEKMDKLGMTIPSVHMSVSLGCFAMPVDSIVKNIRMLHDNYGICNFILTTAFGGLSQAKRWAKLAKKISDSVRPYGCRVLYHNHDDEFHKVSYQGKTVEAMEVFLNLAGDDVMLQLDIGWAGMAGDEMEIVKRYADRIASLHLKDFYPDYRNGQYIRKNMPAEAFAPIGNGGIATKEILSMRQQMPNFDGSIYIDQDDTAGDIMQAMEIGIGNIRTML